MKEIAAVIRHLRSVSKDKLNVLDVIEALRSVNRIVDAKIEKLEEANKISDGKIVALQETVDTWNDLIRQLKKEIGRVE